MRDSWGRWSPGTRGSDAEVHAQTVLDYARLPRIRPKRADIGNDSPRVAVCAMFGPGVPGTPRSARDGHHAGRKVINLRVPISLGRAAIIRIPGISDVTSDRIREAIAGGITGPIIDVEDDNGGVRISIE